MILAPRAREYWVAKWVIPPVALGTLAQYFYTNYVNVELFYKKTPIIAMSSILAAFVNYVLNLLMIPLFGYIAAAYTTLASYLALMLFHYFAVNRVLKEKVYSNMFMFAAMVICGGLGIAMCALYGEGLRMTVTRYAVAAVSLGIFAAVRREDVKQLVMYIKNRKSGEAK